MRILLLGELSGVHKELRHGLKKLGHEVVSAVKGARDIDKGEIFFSNENTSTRWSVIREIYNQLKVVGELKDFDVVQIITPKFFHHIIHKFLLKRIEKKNQVFVLVNTGCSFDYNIGFSTLKYRPCDDCKKFDLSTGNCQYELTNERDLEHFVYNLVDGIVSTGFEYELAMKHAGFLYKNASIALPIGFDRTSVSPIFLASGEKLNIFYGETRFGVKGGAFIAAALDRLEKSEYADKANIIRARNLPFHEYTQLLKSAHVVIDQTNSYGYGMNVVYALGEGKIVLGGCEPESLTVLNIPIDHCPVINILPDGDDIFYKLVELLNGRDKIGDMSKSSLEYVARYHASEVVAAQYIDFYKQLISAKK